MENEQIENVSIEIENMVGNHEKLASKTSANKTISVSNEIAEKGKSETSELVKQMLLFSALGDKDNLEKLLGFSKHCI